ncbi:MAG TPA: response regulator [Bacteroidales bacterium]|nr:response regulator [Bacteroidales bacterium]
MSINKKLKILIAEDEEAAIFFLKIVLEPITRELVIAKNGTEVVALAKQNSDIDLILMDIKMPEMNGYEATRKIREFNKEIIIIAQTAYAIIGDREKALEAGCNDHITKPIKDDHLIEMINLHLSS